jgi:diacylglycerol kinase (ATP)
VHCILIYNPASGRNPSLRLQQVNQVVEALSGEGHSVETACTTGPGSADGQAREASATADVIFACGGDGTIHEVLQGLVSETVAPATAMGIVPMGSANVLARYLRLSLNPCLAALEQVRGRPCVVPVGKVVVADGVRYFSVMAGAGPDGVLAHDLPIEYKSRLGRLAYYRHAARLFLTRRFDAFEAQFTRAGTNWPVTRKTVSVMATRIDNLGGLFRGLTDPRASIQDSTLRLHVLKPPALLSLPLWFLSGWLGLRRFNPLLQCAQVASFTCLPLKSPAPYLQADGESLGQLPMQVSVVPNALRMLLPDR